MPTDPSDPDCEQRESDEIVVAIFEALATRTWTAATDLVEEHWTLLVSYRIEVIRAVAEALPLSVLETLPRWIALRDRMRLPFASQPMMRPDAPRTPDALALLAELVGLTERSVRARERGDFDEAAEIAVSARTIFEWAPAEVRAELHAAAPPLLLQWGTSIHYASRHAEAHAMLERAFAWASAAHNGRVAAAAAGELAWIHAFAGRTSAADTWIERAAQFEMQSRDVRRRHASIRLAVATRYNDRLEHTLALEALEPTGRDVFDLHGTIRASALAAAVGQRPGSDPMQALATLEAHVAQQPAERIASHLNREAIDMSRTLLLMLAGRPAKALPLLNRLAEQGAAPWVYARRAAAYLLLGAADRAELDAARAFDTMETWPRFMVETLAVRAAASLQHGNEAEAAALFESAIRLADTHSIPVALALLSSHTLSALRALRPLPSSTSLQALDRSGVARPQTAAVRQCPTVKEQQVLEVLDVDPSRPIVAVATAIGISVNTLKTHLRSLYGKAGVHDRASLLAAAHDFGWL